MPDNSQRQSSIELELATDSAQQIQLIRFEAHEELSAHFHATVDISTLTEIKLLPNLGLTASVELICEGEHARHFHGVIVDASAKDIESSPMFYTLTLAPALYLHQRNRKYRIFQDKKIIDIIDIVLNEINVKHEIKATGGTRVVKYCVQYGESDFDFVSRLLEEEGLYYHYKHTASEHKMIICDSTSQHDPFDFSFEYNAVSGSIDRTDGKLGEFDEEKTFLQVWTERVSTGGEKKVMMRDYNFIAPQDRLDAKGEQDSGHQQETIEVHEWPGRYYDKGVGDKLAEIAIQARQARRHRYEGSSQFPGISPGFRMTVFYAQGSRHNGDFLVVSSHTTTAAESQRSAMGGGQTRTVFTAIPADVKFRAALRTPRPIVRGPQSAIVTGPASEEIHVDKYGRIKVRFLWDRSNVSDDTSSCWLRVSQTGHLGNMIIPRVGMEVLVDFIEGNPDRPIVVGRVYNESFMPAYKLPDHKTRQVWKTKSYTISSGKAHSGAKSSPSGCPASNEIRLEDKPGEEEFYIHAEKDLNIVVRNDESTIVCRDQKFEVKRDRDGTIIENDKLHVKMDQTVQIDQVQKVTANQKMVLTVGQSSITLEPGSISIKSPQITIEGVGKLDLKTALGTYDGGGMLTLKAGLVKIN